MANRAQSVSRKDFLRFLALTAGAAGLYPAARSLGLAPGAPVREPFQLQGSGSGRRVLILGAGIAGLVAAYELDRAGYDCLILEARRRPGGRIWTVRAGSESEEEDAQAPAEFDDGLFFNAGADRIPQHHRAVLSYCRQFGLPMNTFVTFNTAAYYYHENVGPLSGQKVRLRQAWIDLHGYASALLARGIEHNRIDPGLSGPEKELMLAYLEEYGHLEADLSYSGAGAAGYVEGPGSGFQEGQPLDPLDRSALLQSEYWRHFPFDWDYNWQMALLQPHGGMDQIIRAFEQRIGDRIRYQAEVQEIRRTPDGVRVGYQDLDSGQSHQEDAGYCICTIPLPVLAAIPNDFPAQVQQAIRSIPYLPATRVGLQFARRFWEDDEFIYGGGTFTNLPIGQIWYPSFAFHSAKGILDGAYSLGQAGAELGDLPPDARLSAALDQGSRIHPQYPQEFETGFSVAWHRLPYSSGAWAVYSDEHRSNLYPALFQFDDLIHLAGDHMSYLSGWMEGAVLSAQSVVQEIHQHAGRS